jgi:hypothetical protein
VLDCEACVHISNSDGVPQRSKLSADNIFGIKSSGGQEADFCCLIVEVAYCCRAEGRNERVDWLECNCTKYRKAGATGCAVGMPNVGKEDDWLFNLSAATLRENSDSSILIQY